MVKKFTMLTHKSVHNLLVQSLNFLELCVLLNNSLFHRWYTIWYGRFTCAQKLTLWPA